MEACGPWVRRADDQKMGRLDALHARARVDAGETSVAGTGRWGHHRVSLHPSDHRGRGCAVRGGPAGAMVAGNEPANLVAAHAWKVPDVREAAAVAAGLAWAGLRAWVVRTSQTGQGQAANHEKGRKVRRMAMGCPWDGADMMAAWGQTGKDHAPVEKTFHPCLQVEARQLPVARAVAALDEMMAGAVQADQTGTPPASRWS